ncbi:MAG: amidohydrolase [Thermoleophilia bacterium]|nr:amidohydrolase [Thermoleophilia bacterium]
MSEPRIDAHIHVFPESVLELIREERHPAGIVLLDFDGVTHVVHPEGYRYPLAPEFHRVPVLMEAVKGRGTDSAIVSPAPPLFGYQLAPEEARLMARITNDGVAAIVAERPGELAGLGTIPLANPKDAIAELERAVNELGLAGAEIGPVVDDRWLDHEDFFPVLRAAEELGATLFIHPYYTGHKPGLEDLYLTNLFGNPLDTGLCAARLILSGTLDRLPDLKLLLAHGGGHLPYQAGRLAHGNSVRPELGICSRVPTDYLTRFHYDTILFDPAALNFLIAKVGAERVVFGTDEPFDMAGGSVEDQLSEVDLDTTEEAMITGGTAAALTGVELGLIG